jgi:hypothetical protein
MANSKVCNCNALTVPHVHDNDSIRAASDMEKRVHESAAAGAHPSQSRFNTPVGKS